MSNQLKIMNMSTLYEDRIKATIPQFFTFFSFFDFGPSQKARTNTKGGFFIMKIQNMTMEYEAYSQRYT